MKIQTKIIGLFILAIVSVVSLGLLSVSDASAYTCKYSGDNGGNMYKGKELQYDGGNCYIWKPDEQKDEKRVINTATGQYECTDGTVAYNGSCYTLRKEYSNLKPTNDDGSAVDPRVWESYCKEMGSNFNYDSGRHRCNSVQNVGPDGCTGKDMDSVSVNSCIAPGMDQRADIESFDNLKDQTTQKVRDCANQGGTINQSSHNCEWTTKAACEKRTQGVWVENPLGSGVQGPTTQASKCKQYSDFTNKEDCEKVGGEFKVTGKNNQGQDVWTCVKPGTDPSSNDPTNGGQGGTGGTTSGEKCGQAKTNLIKCNGSGVQAIGDVLRQIIVILTILIGIAAVGGIGYAAILYASATDNASQTQNAISIIRNIVIGILVYGFMIAIVNWLVPGSVIG